jgi:UDP-GlcNAc:undecaprenyl-phosphate/decaprenyl-phosphate GlcNAc-1-phosphate transferase
MTLVVVALASFTLTLLMEKVSRRLDLLALPTGESPTHQSPTPLLGGLAMLVVVAPAIVITSGSRASWVHVCASIALIAGLGLYKDWAQREVWPAGQLALQSASLILLAMGGLRTDLGGGAALDVLVFLLVGLGIMNAMNFLDVMDGLAGGVAVIASLSLALLAFLRGAGPEVTFALWIAVAALGFLARNIPPARIFMGDTGSFGLGLLLTVLVLSGATEVGGAIPLLVLLLPLTVPLVELVVTIVLRIRANRSPMTGDGVHLSLILLARGYSPAEVLLLAYATSAGAALIGALLWIGITRP